MDAIVGAVEGNERGTQVGQGGFRRVARLRFSQHDPHRPFVLVDDLAVPDLIFEATETINAIGSLMHAEFGRGCHFDFGDQVADGGVRSGEGDIGGLAYRAAATVAAHEVECADEASVGECDVDAGIVLDEAGHLLAAIDRHAELFDPAREDALDMLLPQGEAIGMARGEAAEIEMYSREACHLRYLSFAQEAFDDAALIEHFESAGMEAAGTRAKNVLIGAPLDDGHVGPRQRQFGSQHQPGRSTPGDHHCMFAHLRAPIIMDRSPNRGRVLAEGAGLEATPLRATYQNGGNAVSPDACLSGPHRSISQDGTQPPERVGADMSFVEAYSSSVLITAPKTKICAEL